MRGARLVDADSLGEDRGGQPGREREQRRMATLDAAIDPVALEPLAKPVGADVCTGVPAGQQPSSFCRSPQPQVTQRERDRVERLGQRDLTTAELERDHAVLARVDCARSHRRDPCERPSVEQEHAADEPIAKIQVAFVQKPAEDREPLIVVKRLASWQAVVPRDVESPNHARSLEPRQERSDAPADHRAGCDPFVDDVLPKIAQLELLRMEPEDQLDGFGYQQTART